MFLPNVFTMQRSISWNPVNSMHFEREENHRNSINSRSFPEYLPTVYIMLHIFLDPQLHTLNHVA